MDFQGNQEVFEVTWRIANISMHQFHEDIRSSAFIVDFLHKTEWVLSAYRDIYNRIHCYLKRNTSGDCEQAIFIGYSITAVSVHPGKDIKITVKTNTFYKQTKRRANLVLDDVAVESLLLNDVLTIKCQIWKNVQESKDSKPIVPHSPSNALSNLENTSKNDQCSALTRVKQRSNSTVWTIERFSMLRSNQRFCKSVTSVRGDTSFDMTLHLSDESKTDQCVNIEITRKGTFEFRNSVLVYGKIKTLGCPKSIQLEMKSVHFFYHSSNNVWKFPAFLEMSYLTEYFYYTDDVLYLHCEFLYTVSNEEYCYCEMKYFQNPAYRSRKRFDSSRNGFQRLYRQGKFSDVIIRVGTKAFAVHKSILAAASEVFSSKFDTGMSEEDSGAVDITDFDLDTVNRMLNFMYTDSLLEDLSPETAAKLYRAADHYNVLSLKCRCCSILIATLSPSCVCDVLILGDAYQDEDLLQAGRCLIQTNLREVFHSQKWKDLIKTHSQLAAQIMHDVLIKDFLL